MRLASLAMGALVCASPAYAQASGSYVTGDGLNRAAAMVLHCASATGSAGPCGSQGQPLWVGPAAGMANASNQSLQLQAEQGAAAVLGTQQDPAASSGPATINSLLKGAIATLLAGVTSNPSGGLLVSRSASVPAGTSVTLFPANPSRHYLAFQVPGGTAIWVNLVGGPAAQGGVDCAQFAAGQFYESGQFVNRGAITVYSATSVTISAWEG